MNEEGLVHRGAVAPKEGETLRLQNEMRRKSVHGKVPKYNNFMTIKMRIFKSEFELTANSYEDEERSFGQNFYDTFPNIFPSLWPGENNNNSNESVIITYIFSFKC